MIYNGPEMGPCLAWSREEKVAMVTGAKLRRDEVGRDSSQKMEFSNCISVEMGSLWNGVGLQNVLPTYSREEV